MNFWINVKIQLEILSITQKELANLTGINYRTLQNWIGRNILPNVEDGYKIAKALNTNVEHLLGEEEIKPDLKYLELKAKLTELLLEK